MTKQYDPKNSLRDNFISIREQKIVTLYILAKAHKLFVNSRIIIGQSHAPHA